MIDNRDDHEKSVPGCEGASCTVRNPYVPFAAPVSKKQPRLVGMLKKQANYRRKKMREALAAKDVPKYEEHAKWYSAHTKELGQLTSAIHQALEKHKRDFPHLVPSLASKTIPSI